ncbi:MAG: CopD family protein [Bacteroidota bacterium]|nr:CopD family protein [Bacteroidota bacterium]
MESYIYIKALHVIFVVTWFAALFYMPRLLIYHVEAAAKPEPDKTILSEQLKLMQRRLWNAIAWPSMILTWLFGLWMVILNQMLASDGVQDNLLLKPWFILKLVFVFLLSLYHLKTHFIFRKHQRDQLDWTSFRLRLWNEVATVFLFAIIFLVIPKPNSGWVWGILGLILFVAAIFGAVAIYKANREKKADTGEDLNQV